MSAFWNTYLLDFPNLVNAAILTVVLALVAGVIAMVIAIPVGFGRLSRVTIIRSLCTTYVEVVRGTPLLLQLLVWFYGVRILLLTLFHLNVDIIAYDLLTSLNSNSLFPKGGVTGLVLGVIGLGVNYGAYMAEVVRAGILAVDQGQTEAAQTLGLSRLQIARMIVLPQALRLMIPPLTNNFITLVQDTAFLQILAVAELSLVTQGFIAGTTNATIRWGFYVNELLFYFVICYSLSLVARWQERRAARIAAIA
ncbi:MAG TPA: amino acid ABC transporter permease [Ktedonobacterales bacterium]|jgi:His/Glu/Gln/Arg/opine family amino acid ABC transporter permease subunit|nr:amino acid ABC transporter permease [Ktedonobacterales bacterium]